MHTGAFGSLLTGGMSAVRPILTFHLCILNILILSTQPFYIRAVAKTKSRMHSTSSKINNVDSTSSKMKDFIYFCLLYLHLATHFVHPGLILSHNVCIKSVSFNFYCIRCQNRNRAENRKEKYFALLATLSQVLQARVLLKYKPIIF